MKKLMAAFAALTAFTCILTACGSKSSSDSESAETSAASTEASGASTEESSESSTEETTEESSGSATQASTEKTTKSSGNPGSEVEKAFADMVGYVNALEAEKYLDTMYPSKLLDLYIASYKVDAGLERDEVLEQFKEMLTSSTERFPMTYSEYEEEDISDKITEIREALIDIIKEGEAEIGEPLSFDPEEYIIIDKAYSISVKFTDATGEENYTDFVAYDLKGEGWKFDEELVDVLDTDIDTNALASTLSKAASAALADMDAEGLTIDGTFIISSDASLNHNVPASFETDELKEKIEHYLLGDTDYDLTSYDYFIVCKDGECPYAVVQGEDDMIAGIYPAGNIYGSNGPEMPSDAAHTIDDLYEICKSNIK